MMLVEGRPRSGGGARTLGGDTADDELPSMAGEVARDAERDAFDFTGGGVASARDAEDA